MHGRGLPAWYGAIGCTRRLRRDLLGVTAPANMACTGARTSSKVLLSCFRAAACLDRIDRLIRSRNEIGTCRLLRSALPSSMKKVPTSGPDAPPTFHHQRHAIAFSISGSALSASRQRREHGLKPRFMFNP